ncbi:uncharacterized protein BDV14DRAFT_141027 [Aspergillus stella-maris]|uniref:uncharacterized protein n=1 Tax=Aspergillus stella-maris TaxID=1810926 RepID=UPI003CCCA1E9
MPRLGGSERLLSLPQAAGITCCSSEYLWPQAFNPYTNYSSGRRVGRSSVFLLPASSFVVTLTVLDYISPKPGRESNPGSTCSGIASPGLCRSALCLPGGVPQGQTVGIFSPLVMLKNCWLCPIKPLAEPIHSPWKSPAKSGCLAYCFLLVAYAIDHLRLAQVRK